MRHLVLCILIVAVASVTVSKAVATEDILTGYQILPSEDGSFVVFYPPHLGRMAQDVERLLKDSAREIKAELGLETIGTIKVILASDAKTYEVLHRGAIPEWGIAFSSLDPQVLGINVDLVVRNPHPLSTVMRHELSHLLLAQRVKGAAVPTWFMEGLAMRLAGAWSLSPSE